jgi:hypothetical protein
MTVSRVVVYGNMQVRAYDQDNKPIRQFSGSYDSVKLALHHAIAGTSTSLHVAAKDTVRKNQIASRLSKDYFRLIMRRRNSREVLEEENKAVEEAAAVIPS